jgi:catechol 2,3-dioxygenase-like lactoylglutathione lyase family enzyme
LLTRFVHANIVVTDAERSVKFYTEILGGRVVREWISESETAGTGLGLGIGVVKFKTYFLRWGQEDHDLRWGEGPNDFPILDLVEFVEPKAVGAPYQVMNHIGIPRLCFEVDDMDATYEEIRSKGVRFLSEPVQVNPKTKRGAITKVCALYDPDGIVIELIGPLHRSQKRP